MKLLKRFVAIVLLAVLVSVTASAQDATEEAQMEEEMPVLEIAVRVVKEDRMEDFIAARAAFIALLKQQDGVLVDREFESFFALPQPDENPVFIGMTLYESPETVQTVSEAIMGSDEAATFFDTFDMKAFVLVTPPEDFDLETLAAEEGQVLELAVRAVNEGQEEEFITTRDAFVELLDSQEGVLGSFEFDLLSEDAEGRNLTVGMSVYESQELFQAVSAAVTPLPETGDYFQTFVPVAVQYAVSVSNTE